MPCTVLCARLHKAKSQVRSPGTCSHSKGVLLLACLVTGGYAGADALQYSFHFLRVRPRRSKLKIFLVRLHAAWRCGDLVCLRIDRSLLDQCLTLDVVRVSFGRV